MNVLIFEDEKHTANRLTELLKSCDEDIRVVEVLSSVKEGIRWLQEHEMPDLIFQDIILTDGNCFEIFNAVEITAPIIFTTAFSEYAIRSFRVNSIDYIIKPYDIRDIRRALNKLRKFEGAFRLPEKKLLEEIFQKTNFTHKRRFLIRIGDQFQTVNATDIAWLISDKGVTFAVLFDRQRYIVDYPIAELSKQMDLDDFFQINRKIILNIESVGKISTWFSGRLKLHLTPPAKEEIIVSRDRVKKFKAWLDR